ncbi:hypothetical protein BS78_07G147600 [Paspalum vaginatum]|nr:hypothetical protein BS78_07G147600 [Paspalum vaginatum]
MEAVLDVKYRPAALFSNGGVAAAAAAKKMRLATAPAPEAGVYAYRECLKNHAASLGGHALDGCGEFMPAPDADPANPSSLRCAACGCHRNFHRRLPEAPPPPPPLLALPPPPPLQQPAVAVRDSRAAPARGEEAPEDRVPGAFEDETDDSDDGSDFDDDRPLSPLPAPAVGPPGYLHHASTPPHMLLALSTGAAPGVHAPRPAAAPVPPAHAAAAAAAAAARKRFRTKFSPEQKQRMQALSERLGWRLQKRDEALVDECCREIGVTKGVFKVWMHNNKHNFVGGHSARRSASASAGAAASAATATAAAASVHPSPHAAAVHPPAHAPPAAAAPPPPPAPVHADFNINGTADYFRVQASSASGGSPQSS